MNAINFSTHYRSAREAIHDLLADGQWHTWDQLEAAGGNRYGARLDELRAAGHLIESVDLPVDGKRYRLLGAKVMPRERRVRVYLDAADAKELAKGHVTLFAQSAAKAAMAGRR
jgi:hypothetical protein